MRIEGEDTQCCSSSANGALAGVQEIVKEQISDLGARSFFLPRCHLSPGRVGLKNFLLWYQVQYNSQYWYWYQVQ